MKDIVQFGLDGEYRAMTDRPVTLPAFERGQRICIWPSNETAWYATIDHAVRLAKGWRLHLREQRKPIVVTVQS